jgi:hypothetical protein
MEHRETFWTERLQVQDGAYVKVVVRKAADCSERRELVPLFATGPGLAYAKQPDINWNTADAAALGLRRITEWVRMDPATLSLAAEDTFFPAPKLESNPIYRFEVAGAAYLVDAASLVQRVVTLRPELFPILMSPFRDLVVRSRRLGSVVNMVVDRAELRRAEVRRDVSSLSDEDTSCLAYWTSHPERLMQLERCATSILSGEPLWVPRVNCPLTLKVRGLTDGLTTYIQSATSTGTSVLHRDVLWRDGWTSIRVARPYRSRSCGDEIFDKRLVAAPHLQQVSSDTIAHKKCERRRLSASEVQEVCKVVGWL